jgi:maleylacetate reductase
MHCGRQPPCSGAISGRASTTLGKALGAPQALKDLGLSESALDRVADIAVKNPYWNPRPVERDGVRALLQEAWCGSRPR